MSVNQETRRAVIAPDILKRTRKTKSFLLGLAPMEGVTDLPVRLWFRFVGAPDFFMTPFLRLTKDMRPRNIPLLFCPEAFEPGLMGSISTIPQLMAPTAEILAPIASHILQRAPIVDINCACPAAMVVKHGSGSALLRDPQCLSMYVRQLAAFGLEGRFSVKIRAGFRHPEEFPLILEALAPHRLARIYIHGRTREEMYGGSARWHLVEDAARSLDYPVFGSGDIVDRGSFLERRRIAPTAAGIIIGRGALANPWIFSDLADGRDRPLPKDCVPWALSVLAVLEQLARQDPTRLIALMERGVFDFTLGRDALSWRNAFAELQNLALGRVMQLDSFAVDTAVLGRLKRLWVFLGTRLKAETRPALQTHDLNSFHAAVFAAISGNVFIGMDTQPVLL